MLSHGPGFRALYAIYADIIDRAYLPPLRGALDDARAGILEDLETAIGGSVTVADEEFFLKTADHMVEFTLLAEGMRKLGLRCLVAPYYSGTSPRQT